jgi:hypothetical protein
VSIVTVPLADGTRTPVLKLAADDITIGGFTLDVRESANQSGLVTTASQMELHGNVVVYVDSLSGTLSNGQTVTFGASTPPPNNELPPSLLKISLGLVGVTANSVTLTASHQSIM